MSQSPEDLIRNELTQATGKKLGQVANQTIETVDKQNKELDGILSSLHELSDAVGEIKHESSEVHQSSTNLTGQIQKCSHQVQSVSEKMKSLENSFHAINKMMRNIQSITDQTKLLALNATIEASRAGEAGKGFAVVASEVKELSTVTRNSNEEISKALAEVQSAINQLAESLSNTNSIIQESIVQAEHSHDKVLNITQQTDHLYGTMAQTISSATHVKERISAVTQDLDEMRTIDKTFKYLIRLLEEQGLFTERNDPTALFESIAETSTFFDAKRFPAGEKEIKMKDSDVIISSTDTKGVITYANKIFYDFAGFEQGSLVGKPHNIIRHPDMPKAGFAHLWSTIQAGKMWNGVVLNKGRKGVIYWVRAIVFPCFDDGKITGYISVRVKPSSSEIARAIKAYRRLP